MLRLLEYSHSKRVTLNECLYPIDNIWSTDKNIVMIYELNRIDMFLML